MLESLNIISKRKLPHNKKENIYLLTEIGIDMAPIIMELVIWSDKHVRLHNPGMNSHTIGDIHKSTIVENTQKEYRDFVRTIIPESK